MNLPPKMILSVLFLYLDFIHSYDKVGLVCHENNVVKSSVAGFERFQLSPFLLLLPG